MFLRIIVFLGLVATISLGVNWISENNGTVEFIWLGYKVNTSVAFVIFALVFSIILLIIILQILVALITFPKKAGRKYQQFQLEQNLKTLQIGYAALLSGDHDQAARASQRLLGSNVKSKSLMNMSDMLAAKVAQEKGDVAVAQDYFNKFMDNKKQRFFAVKSMLDTSFSQGNIDSALSYAEDAYKLKPNVKDGARSVLELYKKAERYAEAEEFLRRYARRHRLFKDKYNDIDVKRELSQIWYIRGKQLFENDSSVSITDHADLTQARDLLEKANKYEPNNKEIITLLLKIYKPLKAERRAKDVVEKVWDKMASVELGSLYLEVLSSPNYKDITKKKLKAIEGLQKISLHPTIIERLRDKVYDIRIEY